MANLLPVLFTLCMFHAPATAGLAANIYPDPGFEATGETGVAHTGQKAGHLKVEAMNHWAGIGGPLAVEPFAKYRLTEWVKGKITRAGLFGPYVYQWDNYEWQFVRCVPIPPGEEWSQVELTFISPYSTMYVHPLAYVDAEHSEAWVDDITVEKIAEPADAMAELAAKAECSPDETQILARWYVQQADLAAAKALLPSVSDLARTDIACLIAQHTPDLAARRPYVVEMVAYGGPTFHDGLKRFDEITAGMTNEEKLKIAEEAVLANPASDRAARSFRLIWDHLCPAARDSVACVAVRQASLTTLRDSLERLLAQLPVDTPAASQVKATMDDLDAAMKDLEARKASLGHCVVRIGGKALTANTHAILIPNTPTPQEHRAARELQYHLELITGQALPIWYETDADKCTPLVVGKCDLIKTLGAEIDFPSLGMEGIHIKTIGPALILAGNKRGVLYATYQFLEDYLGCRWFTPDCATWPKEGEISVPAIDRRYVPPLELRMGDYPVARPGDFAARCRLNGSNHWLTEEHGGFMGVHSLAHTFAALVPPEKYYRDHPEYFALVNGKRHSGYAQLCLTNPDVLRIVIEGVRRWIKEHPQHSVFSVSQNDVWNYCECDNCRAVVEEEGSQAGPIIRFCNAVADAIKDEFPHIAIETLAYTYSRKPPRITRPRPNVIVCLCSIECCFIHPLESDPFNKTFVDDIRGWSEICQRLWIWDYIINYAHSVCPFPNLYALKPNINFFISNGVKGIYEESCYFTKGSELQELRNYIIAKTLWDPSYDTDQAIDEFCAAYYGAAAPFVRAYINLVHKSTQQDPNLHVAIYTHPRNYVTQEMLAEAQRLFDQAEQAVSDDPTLLHRVQVARLPILYAAITLATGGAFAERGDKLVQEGGTDIAALAERFEKIARAEGLTMISEGGSLEAWLASIPRRPTELQIQRLQNPTLQLAILPELGGRIWRMRHLPSGRDLLRLAGTEGAWDPSEGGYEEFSEGTYRSPGWNEPFTVKDRTDRSITLEAALRNGLRLTRHLELDPGRPLLTITSTLTNTAGEPRTACLRTHPEFTVTSTERASVRVLGPREVWTNISLSNPADPSAEKDTWLRGEELPAGAWALVDEAADIALLSRWPREQVAQCLLNHSGAKGRVNLELFGPEIKLGPGQTVSLEHSYEVVQPAGQLPN